MNPAPRIVIVGAGFGGIGAAVELRRHGFDDVRILDAAPGLGGTWYHNSYPGAACDVPSHLYSFSFEPRRDWSRLCSPQSEILGYLRDVADRHGITPLIRLGERVTRCAYDDTAGVWHLDTAAGARHDADVVILATGQLNRPAIPALPGRFGGHSFHSARWDHAYDLTGRRVAVVGTGASAIQFVPEIAPHVARLTIFQRSGNWLLPRRNRVYKPWVRAAIRTVPGLQRLRRLILRNYIESLTLAIRHPRTAGRLLGLRSALFMRSQLTDPELRRRAWPDYTFGCKRILFSSRYLPTLARPNVELSTQAIDRLTETGIVTADGRHHEVDCIVWATGFAARELVAPMEVVGAGGGRLGDAWAAGPRAHLGITVPGFPSLFFMYGPNTNTSGGSIIAFLEAQAGYIRQALAHARAGGWRRIEVRPEVEAASDQEIQARFAGTAWLDCDSWYRDRSGRIVTNWPGYMREYVNRVRTFAPHEFRFA